ncbi:trimeric intracellular cation channel family protein [Thermus sp. PS18]|uniref:trimeric intracellular cation channel family protein n=1 Tax=Thermus sp. PS18 TaxID=2849039 RepID=UPI00226549AE|nr:trimeric intracellular cation channel family protein [Thermus sp. PS18]UZX15975.1 trimeric intracellular cation channel family protein [Thermus sp. PS18]
MVEVLVWLGTLVFAATGALKGVEKGFDLLGVLVLATVTAVGGGSIRDVLVGTLPPTALHNEPLLWSVVLTGLLVFRFHPRVQAMERLIYYLDTLGLGLFAALGAERGLASGLGPFGVALAGTLSGVGGGVLRDVLSGEVPGILYRAGDLYASAALVGALVVYALYGTHPEGALFAGTLATVLLRIFGRRLGLRLPTPR